MSCIGGYTYACVQKKYGKKKEKGKLKIKEIPLDVPIVLQGVWLDETKSLWDEVIKRTSADFISHCSELTARRHQDIT